MNSRRRLTVGLFAAFLMTGAVNAPAIAADGYQLAEPDNYGSYQGYKLKVAGGLSEGSFVPDGDLLVLWDYDSDSKSVGIKWSTSGGRSGLCRWTGGAGYRGSCDKDFSESASITFSVGLCNQTASVDCRTWNDYTNKNGPTTVPVS